MRTQTKVFALIGILLIVGVLRDVIVIAQGTSGSYRIDESYIGPGGNLESNSGGFRLESGQQSLGNTGGSTGSSNNFTSVAGATTTSDPRLSCSINTSSVNFGGLSSNVASTGSATFSVLNYTSYGYIVTIAGSPPSSGSYTLANMGSTGASQAGVEQFGINLVANTSPTTFGANPVQVPDNTFSFGQAASNYNTANNYRFNIGETIASAPKSSGQTNYTISFLINIANETAGGRYTANQAIICNGTY